MLKVAHPRAPPQPLVCPCSSLSAQPDAVEGFAFSSATTSTHLSFLLTGCRVSPHTATLHAQPGDSFAALASTGCGPLSADAHLACDAGLVTASCSACLAVKAARLEAERSWPPETLVLLGLGGHSLALRLESAPTLELALARRQLTARAARDGLVEVKLRAQAGRGADGQLLERSLSLRRSPGGPELRAAAACTAGLAVVRSTLLMRPCGVCESSLAVSLPSCGLTAKAARSASGKLLCALSGRVQHVLAVRVSCGDGESPGVALACEAEASHGRLAAELRADGVAAALHWGVLRRS